MSGQIYNFLLFSDQILPDLNSNLFTVSKKQHCISTQTQISAVMVPSDHQGQGLMRALHQRDGLLTGAAEGNGVHAHHFITGLETD